MIINLSTIDNVKLNFDIKNIMLNMNEKSHLNENGLLVGYSFNKEYSIFNENIFNIFTTYNKQITSIYLNIAKLVSSKNLEIKLNSEKSMQHISGKIFEKPRSFDKLYYDYATSLPGSYFGFYIIESNNSTLNIDDKSIELNNGDLLLYKGGQKVKFDKLTSEFNAIEFYVMPLHYLNGQYYQKWCPIIC